MKKAEDGDKKQNIFDKKTSKPHQEPSSLKQGEERKSQRTPREPHELKDKEQRPHR